MNISQPEKSSNISLVDRKEFSVDGVVDILLFDETQLMIRTVLGDLCLEGDELRVTSLSLEHGRMSLEGKLDGLYYLSDAVKKNKKKSRLFGGKG